MVAVPAGRFLMGSPQHEKKFNYDEGPQHEVIISQPLALGRFQVTFEEYHYFCEQVGREKPIDQSKDRGRHPVINVNAADAEDYCTWLSEITSATYRLPTEAEWEYACRAGTTTAYAFGDEITEKHGNFGGFAQGPRPVGSYRPNGWHLHYMHGNVWEWCADSKRGYARGVVADPRGELSLEERVLRGGSWSHDVQHTRSACRYLSDATQRSSYIGFRCARVQDKQKNEGN